MRVMKCCRMFSLLGVACTAASVCTAAPPPNDDFTNAIVLTGSSITFTGSLAGATEEAGEPNNGYGYLNSVWWRWTAPDNTAVTFELVQNERVAGGQAYIEAFRGTNLSSLTAIDNTPLELFSGSMPIKRYSSFVPDVGATYYLRGAVKWGTQSELFVVRLTTTNPPIILTQPEDASVGQFGTALFRVVAAGVAPLRYQWRFNGADLSGETFPTLEKSYVSTNQGGSYSVVVSNLTGVSTSAIANLTVSATNPHPVLTVLSPSASDRLAFALQGEVGRWYRIEYSTNLTEWHDEISLHVPFGVVYLANATASFSVPYTDRKFIRATLYSETENCIKNLARLTFAMRLWTTEHKLPLTASVTISDLLPYARDNPPCASGGSYSPPATVVGAITCTLGVSLGHTLPQ